MYGLKYIPISDDGDRDTPYRNIKVQQEFSSNNHYVMKEALLSLGDKCKMILEIGVARNNLVSSTYTLIYNMPRDCNYLGVDKDDKTFLMSDHIYTLQTDSSDYSAVLDKIEDISGKKEIDFIHIDGWHSVNQIVRDWAYVENLTQHGVVMLHDTNWHPGPLALLEAVDENIFDIERYFVGASDDWGVAVLRRK